MSSPTAWNEILLDSIRENVTKYPEYVPSTLAELEHFRLSTIPAVLERRKKDGEPYLHKVELLKLVEWKLKHGTFRPTLMKLVSSNTDDTVHKTTAKAYATYTFGNASQVLPVLTALSGIGPATASLILSVFDPTNAPFFSDELFRYLHSEPDADGELQGWSRKIGYTKKEYDELCSRVHQIQTRLKESGSGDEEGVTALDLEKLAYVLARSSAGPSSRKGRSQEEQVRDQKSAPIAKPGPANNKRNIAEIQQTSEPMADDEGTVKQRYPSRKRGKT